MSGRSERELIGDCVHCGFCLPACPTYLSWGEEPDSPRGRIDLLKGVVDGELRLDAAVARHFDACLGCMACMTACPSGVRYDLLLASARGRVERTVPRSLPDRAFRAFVFALFPYPARLRAAALPLIAYARSGLRRLVRRSGLLDRLPLRLRRLEALLPDIGFADLGRDVAAFTPATGSARARVGLVAGCVQRAYFPAVNEATVRVLAAEGCEVVVPADQGCCGALSAHAGRHAEARGFAQALIARFERERLDAILVNAAGCGSALKDVAELFAGDETWHARATAFAARVHDVTEFLAALEPRAPRRPVHARVAYHDACHLAHAQGVRAQPRALLRAIPGIELLEIPAGEQCCGSAGTYNLFEPAAALEIGERKADAVASLDPDVVVSANPGCTLQIGAVLRSRGVRLSAAHPIEILDASICGTPLR